jgi:hypothetical protein
LGQVLNSFDQAIDFVFRRIAGATGAHKTFSPKTKAFDHSGRVKISVRKKQPALCQSARHFS